jgi:hypothetical protein
MMMVTLPVRTWMLSVPPVELVGSRCGASGAWFGSMRSPVFELGVMVGGFTSCTTLVSVLRMSMTEKLPVSAAATCCPSAVPLRLLSMLAEVTCAPAAAACAAVKFAAAAPKFGSKVRASSKYRDASSKRPSSDACRPRQYASRAFRLVVA